MTTHPLDPLLALSHPLIYYVEAARSQLGACRPDDPDEADFWDGLTVVAQALSRPATELPELPDPAVYMRDTDGRLEAKIGGDRPCDRSGGYSTPWGFFYTADQMRAYATEHAAYWKEMWRAANARGDGLEGELAKWKELASDAIYVGCMIGLDCAGALADLQERGVYKPRCDDDKPSNADARKDANHIKEIYRRGLDMLREDRERTPPTPGSEVRP